MYVFVDSSICLWWYCHALSLSVLLSVWVPMYPKRFLIHKHMNILPISKRFASIDWRLVFHVWSFITPGAFWGKTVAWRRCACDGRGESQYAYAILPRCKLARYLVCVKPRAISRRGCVLPCFLHVDNTRQSLFGDGHQYKTLPLLLLARGSRQTM